MRDIADRLGLVKGNLYYYFKNKQDILYHCHVKCIAISLAALDEVGRWALPPPMRSASCWSSISETSPRTPYGGVLLTDLESLTPTQRKRYVAMRDRFEQGVREMIRGGIADGTFAPQNIDLAGITILGAINWIPKWYRPDGPMSVRRDRRQDRRPVDRSLRP